MLLLFLSPLHVSDLLYLCRYSVQQVNSVLGKREQAGRERLEFEREKFTHLSAVDSYLEPKSKKSIPLWVFIVFALLVVVIVVLIVAFIVYVVVRKRRTSHDVHYAQVTEVKKRRRVIRTEEDGEERKEKKRK